MHWNRQHEAQAFRMEFCSQQHRRPWSGGEAGPRRMPAGCGAERNGPRLGNTGALTTGFLTGVR
jgi:hypothetical protein